MYLPSKVLSKVLSYFRTQEVHARVRCTRTVPSIHATCTCTRTVRVALLVGRISMFVLPLDTWYTQGTNKLATTKVRKYFRTFVRKYFRIYFRKYFRKYFRTLKYSCSVCSCVQLYTYMYTYTTTLYSCIYLRCSDRYSTDIHIILPYNIVHYSRAS